MYHAVLVVSRQGHSLNVAHTKRPLQIHGKLPFFSLIANPQVLLSHNCDLFTQWSYSTFQAHFPGNLRMLQFHEYFKSHFIVSYNSCNLIERQIASLCHSGTIEQCNGLTLALSCQYKMTFWLVLISACLAWFFTRIFQFSPKKVCVHSTSSSKMQQDLDLMTSKIILHCC